MKRKTPALKIMALKTLALTGASTVSFIALGLYFSTIAFGAVYLWKNSHGDGLYSLISAIIAVTAIAALVTVIITGVLQIREPQPRLTRLTAFMTLGWAVLTFTLYAALVLGIGVMTDVSLPYTSQIAMDSLQVMAGMLLTISIALILPALRNGLRFRQRAVAAS
ncbi:hypothetical protein ACFFUB_15255 [Algimonas porphyrae]|uniref:DUF2975 domain-containing protein n=1 Tax=Algimonas porphyrae TaxID=1128113 RepID=A0ABQ5UWV2_9PROT|nr:hypothetical protein [Algimonas porphyrae]GLQ19785.1 hypothetical protein GCM10007854_07400 [Algimonas porphyrae]